MRDPTTINESQYYINGKKSSTQHTPVMNMRTCNTAFIIEDIENTCTIPSVSTNLKVLKVGVTGKTTIS